MDMRHEKYSGFVFGDPFSSFSRVITFFLLLRGLSSSTSDWSVVVGSDTGFVENFPGGDLATPGR